jgi:hypothetical protein
MKLLFLKEDALDTLKGNISTNLNKYTNISNDWIDDFFNGQSPFVEYKLLVNDFTLDMSSEKPEETDIENVKRIYTNMIALTETQASDGRLWTGLAHGVFWEYMRYRWSVSKRKPTELDINNHFFFGSSSMRRSLFTNSLSRLWWIGRLTYDEKRTNPFELTEYLRKDFATRTHDLFSSNYSSNPTINRALLSSAIELERQNIQISRKVFREMIKYFNIFGGTHILDYFTEKELKDKITKKAIELVVA